MLLMLTYTATLYIEIGVLQNESMSECLSYNPGASASQSQHSLVQSARHLGHSIHELGILKHTPTSLKILLLLHCVPGFRLRVVPPLDNTSAGTKRQHLIVERHQLYQTEPLTNAAGQIPPSYSAVAPVCLKAATCPCRLPKKGHCRNAHTAHKNIPWSAYLLLVNFIQLVYTPCRRHHHTK